MIVSTLSLFFLECLLLGRKAIQALKPFMDPIELQQAVDVILSQEIVAVAEVEATYGPIEYWDVSQVSDFADLFSADTRNPLAASVSFDLSRWNVSNARAMNGMFLGASMMDFDVSSWDVSRNEKFQGMFENAKSFQGRGLEKWNVSSGKLFMVMLAKTPSLIPGLDLRSWNVHNAERLTAMFRNSNFGVTSASTNETRADDLSFNLCSWALRLSPRADTKNMFLQSQCPNTSDPQLLPPSANSLSFCVPCDVRPSHPATTPVKQLFSSDRPNILLIMADQMRYDMIRFVQDSLNHYNDHFKIQTPNLDKLKQQGVYFESAYCQCAVCAPARTSLRTGCTIERTGVQHNDLIYEDEYRKSAIFEERIESMESIDHILVEKLGYISEYYGKWHMPATLATSKVDGKPILQNNDYDFKTDTFYYANDETTKKLRRYLDYFEELGQIDKSLNEEGMQYDTYTKFPYTPIQLDARFGMPSGADLDDLNLPQSKKTEPNIMGRYKLSEYFTPSFFEGSVAVKALNRLRQQRRGGGKPWFLTASFHSPHAPFVPAWNHLEKYWENRFQLLVPPSLNDNMNASAYRPITKKIPLYGDPVMVQEWTALYYALIEEVDDYVGLLLDALGEDASNTLVIFTSDHGEMLGSHGMREKNSFYEESSRIPLLMSFPGVIEANSHVKEHVGHIDLLATILDFIGAAEMDHSDGSSLRPIIERNNDKVNHRFDQSVTFGEWDYRKVLGSDPNKLDRRIDDRPSFMVVKGSYKLMMQKLSDSHEIDMMFNLIEDPLERNNLLGRNAMDADKAVVIKAEHMRCLLLDWMERLDGGFNGDQAYFSDTANNYNNRGGDITEIRNRQQWKQIGLWTSSWVDHPLEFGTVSWTGSEFVRHEWLYMGNRKNKNYTIDSAMFTGKDSVHFSIDNDAVVGRAIGENSCVSIRVTFRATKWTETMNIDAALLLTLSSSDSDGQVHVIPLTLGDLDFTTRRMMSVQAETKNTGTLSKETANLRAGHRMEHRQSR
ncbi:sulfatase [Nitzschia inconspicua]|uniref:Sulfatase n=1 Tax=Nitzschia inconspicua TaxID=303405 RepID=A0A9K3KTK8_9STRA|nr:sulfatase [Nitzschia inconspicua]